MMFTGFLEVLSSCMLALAALTAAYALRAQRDGSAVAGRKAVATIALAIGLVAHVVVYGVSTRTIDTIAALCAVAAVVAMWDATARCDLYTRGNRETMVDLQRIREKLR